MFVPALFCFAFALLMIVVWIVFSMVGGQNDDARLSFSKKFGSSEFLLVNRSCNVFDHP